MKRPYSNDGSRTSVAHVLPIRAELLRSWAPEPPKPKREPRLFNGPKARTASKHRVSPLTDAQFLAMRALRELKGWSARRIAEHFECPLHTAQSVVNGYTRCYLIPTAADIPEGIE